MNLSRRAQDLWSGIVCLLIALFYLYTDFSNLLFWTPGHQPGAGFLPTLLGCSMAGLSCILIVRGLRMPANAGGARSSIDREAIKKPLTVFGALVVFVVLFETIGYIITTWVMTGGLMWAFVPGASARRRAVMSVAISGLAVLVFYGVFGAIFGLQLPPWPAFLS